MESKKGREGDQCVEYPHVQFGEGEVEPVATLRRGTSLTKKLIVLAMAMVTTVTFAVPEVTDVTAKQRYPWNGLVDITCKVSGIDGMTNGITFGVSAIMPDSRGARKVSHFWVVQDGTNLTDYEVHTNGNYQLVWDTQADLGQVIFSNMVVRVTTTKRHSKVQLWENGPYWAETNIGAEEPWEYGWYFWWGDTVGYKRENDSWVASDGSSSNFSFISANVPTYDMDVSALQNQGWITADNILKLEHDAAHEQWGDGWRMPTAQELRDLCNKCNCSPGSMNGVAGYVFSGKGEYASVSIFLPRASYGAGTSLSEEGSLEGGYWSSVPGSATSYNEVSYYLFFFSRNLFVFTDNGYRSRGRSIRPVQGAIK